MRITSIIWFAVFMRKERARGAYVTAIKKGADQAGALFVIHNHLDGALTLYAPAPQSFIEEDDGDRHFEVALDKVDQETLDAYLEKQKRFDPDLWMIETESGDGQPSLEIV